MVAELTDDRIAICSKSRRGVGDTLTCRVRSVRDDDFFRESDFDEAVPRDLMVGVKGDLEVVIWLISGVGLRGNSHVREGSRGQRPWHLAEVLIDQVLIMNQDRHSHPFDFTCA